MKASADKQKSSRKNLHLLIYYFVLLAPVQKQHLNHLLLIHLKCVKLKIYIYIKKKREIIQSILWFHAKQGSNKHINRIHVHLYIKVYETVCDEEYLFL